MEAELSRPFARMGALKQKYCDELTGWSAERIRFRPSPEAWSAIDIVDHLIRTEASMLAMMKREKDKGQRTTIADKVRSWTIRTLMRTPVRLQMPQPMVSDITPQHTEDFRSLISQWNEVRNQFREFLNGLGREECRQRMLRHPVSGWTDAGGVLRLLEAHMVHHEYQLRRLRRDSHLAASAWS